MRSPLVVAAFAAWLCAAPALSAPRAKGKEQVDTLAARLKESEQLYAAGQYREAAALLEQLMEEAPNPAILYNLARAWDQAGELEKALKGYQQYVSSQDGTDPTRLKRSSLSIDRIKGILAQREADRRAAAEEVRRAEDEAKAAKKKAQAETEAARLAQEEAEAAVYARAEAERAGRARLRVGSVASSIIGLGALGAGTWFGLSSRETYKKFQAEETNTVEAKSALAATTRQQALYADIGFAVGAAALVTAVLLWPKGGGDASEHEPAEDGGPNETSEDEVSWQVGFTPLSAGVLVRF
jgi:tetratricopeptide (TPR) repeat protein